MDALLLAKVLLAFLISPVTAWDFFGYCFRDCCGDFEYKEEKLERDFRLRLHGQPLVRATVPGALERHFRSRHPSKAMVLSFHGWTGSGKNYASQMIAEAMFKKGMKSTSVRLFIASVEFTNPAHVDRYKEELQRIITKQIKKCSRALFIFDEMDKLPIGLLDAIKPFLEHFEDVAGVDPRNAVFIFLSNSAGKIINEMVYNDWLVNKPRESISLSAIQSKLSSTAYNEVKGGLWRSFLIESHVITSFIPFLPLEKKHVMLCIREEAKRAGLDTVTDSAVEHMADELAYWPEDTQVFSLSGCKRIPELVKINYYSLSKIHYKSEL